MIKKTWAIRLSIILLAIISACATTPSTPPPPKSPIKHYKAPLLPMDMVSYLKVGFLDLQYVDAKKFYAGNSQMVELLPGTYEFGFSLPYNQQHRSNAILFARITMEPGRIYQATQKILKNRWGVKIGHFSDNIEDCPGFIFKKEERVMDTIEAYKWRSKSYLQIGKYSECIADCNEILKSEPNANSFYRRRGLAYYRSKQYNKAVTDFNKTIEFESNNHNLFNDRGNAYFNMKRYDKSIADYSKAITISENHGAQIGNLYGNRAGAYRLSGQLENAMHDFNHAIELLPKDSNKFDGRALLYRDLDNHSKACEDWKQACDLGWCAGFQANCSDEIIFNAAAGYVDRLREDKKLYNKPESSQNSTQGPYFNLWYDDTVWNAQEGMELIVDSNSRGLPLTKKHLHYKKKDNVAAYVMTEKENRLYSVTLNRTRTAILKVFKKKLTNLNEQIRYVNNKKMLYLTVELLEKKENCVLQCYLGYFDINLYERGVVRLVIVSPKEIYEDSHSDFEDLLNGLYLINPNTGENLIES